MKRTYGTLCLALMVCGSAACGNSSAPPPAAAPAPAPAASNPPVQAAPNHETPAATVAESPAASPPPVAPRDPQRALALVEEGRKIQRERGEGGTADAIGKYTEALAADPQCAAALWELGWSHQVVAHWDEAVAAWDKLKAIDPNYPEFSVHYPVLVLRRDQAARIAALPDPGVLPPPELQPAGPSITFNAVGDCHLGMAWPPQRAHLPPNDARDVYMHVKDILSDADVTFGNLETALRDEGDSYKCGPKSTHCFAFRVPTAFATAIQEAGFDVVSTANNHAGDFGEEGRASTRKALDGVGVKHSGPIGDIASLTVKGLRVGLVAFAPGAGVYDLNDLDAARRVVADVARTHDIVLVSFHGGAEGTGAGRVVQGHEFFFGEDRGDLRAFTHAVIDAGADLVLGSGPHRLRAMELYKGRLIAYSLGNFSTWDTFSLEGALSVTGILNVTLAANGVLTDVKFHSALIEKPGRPRPDDKNQGTAIIRDLSKQDFGDPFLSPDGTWHRQAQVSMW